MNWRQPFCTWLTFGGYLIYLPSDVGTLTSDMDTARILVNITISTPGARFTTVDLKDFYLNTSMDHFKYMKILLILYPRKSSPSTTSTNSNTTVLSTAKSKKSCTVYHNPVWLRKISSKNDLQNTNIIQPQPGQAYGSMILVQPYFPSLSTTLE